MPTLPTQGGDIGTWGSELNDWLTKGGLTFNVKDGYGAVGDGVADDTAEIQLAIDAAETAGGGFVFFPRGNYLISASLTVPSFVTLQGVGGPYRAAEYSITPATSGSRIVGPATSTFVYVKNEDATNGNVGIEIRGLRFVMGGSTTSTSARSVVFDKVRRSLIRDCYFEHANTTDRIAIHVKGGSEHNAIEDCSLEGACILEDGGSNRLLIRNCEVGGAIKLSGGSHDIVEGCDIWQDGMAAFPQPDGIYLTTCQDTQVLGNQVAEAQNHGIRLDGGSVGCVIANNSVVNSSEGTAGVWNGITVNSDGAVGTTNNIVIGNRCYDRQGTKTQGYGIAVLSTGGADLTAHNLIVGNALSGNLTGSLTVAAAVAGTNVIQGNQGAPTSVASAAALPVPPDGDVFHVTGTTTVTSIAAGAESLGRRITLIFDGILTFTDGSNLKLAGNLVTTADDTLSLVCDGTNWFEAGRSVN